MAQTPTDSSDPVALPVYVYTTSDVARSFAAPWAAPWTSAEPWTSAVRQNFVEDASADAVSAADTATNGARADALAQPEPDAGALTLTVERRDAPIDIALDPDGLLEGLVTLYIMDGWAGIKDTNGSLDREIARRFPDSGTAAPSDTATDVFGTPASALDPQSETSDRSGYPSYYDFIGQPGALQSTEAAADQRAAERARWDEARKSFDQARDRMVFSVIDALKRVEQLAIDLAMLGLNRARDAAATQRQRYGIDELKQAAAKAKGSDAQQAVGASKGDQASTSQAAQPQSAPPAGQPSQGEDASSQGASSQGASSQPAQSGPTAGTPGQSQSTATPPAQSSDASQQPAPSTGAGQGSGAPGASKDAPPAKESPEQRKAREQRESLASLKTLMKRLTAAKQDVQTTDQRYGRAVALQNRDQKSNVASTPDTDIGTPEEEYAYRTAARAGFENMLADGRNEHPLCAPLLVVLKPDFADDDLVGAIDEFTTTLISIPENFKPAPPRMGAIGDDSSSWQRVLDDGPEAWLLDRAADGSGFDPLLDEGVLALVEDEPSLEPFEFAVLENFRDAMWQRAEAREAARQASEAAMQRWLLITSAAGFIFPPATTVAEALGAIMTISSAIDAVKSVIFLNASFAARAQSAMALVSGEGTFADWQTLGAVLRAQPQAMDYARALLNAGLALADIEGLVRHVPWARLALLMALRASLDES